MSKLPAGRDWTEDRLDVAFHARFDAESPSPGLPDRIHDAILDSRHGRLAPLVRAVQLGATPALLALILLVVGFGASRVLPGPSAGATGRPGGAGSPVPDPTKVAGAAIPATFTVPGSTEAVPVLTVAEALARRAADRTGPELVVGGWYVMNPVPCGALPDATSGLENCAADFTWLMDAPEQLRDLQSDGSGSIHPPAGPGVNLVLAAHNWNAPSTETGPVPIVVIGHFDDTGAADCPAGERRTRCAGRFVVDAPLWATGVAIDLTAAPPSMHGMDVRSVAQAIAVRDSGSSDTIAVVGWFSTPTAFFFSCPMTPATGPTWLEGRCAAAMAWLLADAEGIVIRGPDGTTFRRPTVPAIQPAFEDGMPWPLGNGLPNLGPQIAMPAVLIGHFNDPRSADCTPNADLSYPDAVTACKWRFVVESVAWLNGSALESYP